jgi:hypothetical protein
VATLRRSHTMAPKPSNSGSRWSPRIACFGTAFLVDDPVDTEALKGEIAPNVPQFSSPRLDASFFINCGRFLAGKLTTTETPSIYVKRVAGSDFHSPKATVFYECSTELQGLLADLTPKRGAEFATEWYGMHGPPNAKLAEPNGRMQIRLAILKNLAALARQAEDHNKTLILRVEYRKQL